MKKTFLIIALGLLGSGCDREAIAAAGSLDDRVHAIRWSADDCDEVVVPNGFTMGWKKLNHRLAQWSVGLDQKECAPRRFHVTHIGGVFSKNPIVDDEPWVRLEYQRGRVSAKQFGIARVSLRDTIGPSGTVRGEATFSAAELGLGDFRHHTVLIEGIHFDTGVEQTEDYPSLYNPKRGYTTRGIGAAVNVERSGDELVVSYRASFMPGRTPERVFMNAALPYARIGAGIDAIVVGSNSDIARASVRYSMKNERSPLFEDVRLPAAEEKLRTVRIAGRPQEPPGFWGLQRFHFDLDFDDDCANDDECTWGSCVENKCDIEAGKLGEYIREFSVGVKMKDFDPETGRADFVVDGYTSNASSFLSYYPLRYQFDGAFAWLQADGDFEQSELNNPFQTGSASFDIH